MRLGACSECEQAFAFAPMGRVRKTCSPACALSRRLRLQREVTKELRELRAKEPSRPCEQCSGPISPLRHRDARFCSAACAKRSWHLAHKPRSPSLPPHRVRVALRALDEGATVIAAAMRSGLSDSSVRRLIRWRDQAPQMARAA